MYRLMKLVDNEWYEWGVYSDLKNLCNACFFLGQAGVERIKIEEVGSE